MAVLCAVLCCAVLHSVETFNELCDEGERLHKDSEGFRHHLAQCDDTLYTQSIALHRRRSASSHFVAR